LRAANAAKLGLAASRKRAVSGGLDTKQAQPRFRMQKRDLGISAKFAFLLKKLVVAGAGFEPTTFGL